jgi:hypothetical protein
MISRDFFSVANNLGDSVAFNLESDTNPSLCFRICLKGLPDITSFMVDFSPELQQVTPFGLSFPR